MPNLREMRPGLHRWTATHPDWEEDEGGADGWEPEVASLAYAGEGALVLVDPLVAGDDWRELDELVEATGDPVSIVITCHWHSRSGGDALRRYVNSPGATTHTHSAGVRKMPFEVTHPFEGDASLPGGVDAIESDRGHGEAVLWLERAKTLVVGDVLLGAQGTRTEALRLCPEDWLDGTTLDDVRNALRPLTRLPVEAVVPLHGAPVLEGAADALKAAIDRPGFP